MLRGRSLPVIICLIVLMSSLGSLATPMGQAAPSAPLTPSEPIEIIGESDLQSMVTAGDCYGSGSSSDPYVLENRTLAWYGSGPAIHITDTTSQLIIRNCTLTGTPSLDMASYSYGILIYNATNVQIDRCVISNFSLNVMVGTGGAIGGCDQITVSNCSISGPSNGYSHSGIYMGSVGHASINDNRITRCNYGMYLSNFDYGSVYANNVSFNGRGLWMSSDSAGNVIQGNLFASNAQPISVEGSGNLIYENAFIVSSVERYPTFIQVMTGANAWNTTDGKGNYWGNQYSQALGGNESFIGHSVDWQGPVGNRDFHPYSDIIAAPEMAVPVITTSSVSLSWSVPSYNLGPEITGYVITRSDGASFSVRAGTTTYTDVLTGTWSHYSYSVQAQNGWGLGGISAAMDAQNPDRPALAITSSLNTSVWATTGDEINSISPRNILVQWTGYDSNSVLADHELSSYQVTLDNGTWIAVGTSTSYTFDKIIEGKHAVQVKGLDSDGNIATAEKYFSVYKLLVLDMDLSSLKMTLGSDVTADIVVTDYATGEPVSQVAIDFYQSVDGGMTYATSKFSSASTDNEGKATTSFIPAATSNYVIQARAYSGNIVRQSYANVSLTVSAYEGKNAFSVQSTSTVTDLSFDSATKVLRFTVSGVSGTTGETKVMIAKSLVADGHSVDVSLDQSAIEYTVSEMGDYWVLTFTYHHSAHAIAVGMPTLGMQASGGIMGLDPAILIVLVGVVAGVLVGVLLVRRRRA
jgi:parallel beta-helix repeat protein